MTHFCPYCGRQLSDRSKFCPLCGKAKPERRGQPPAEIDVKAQTPRAVARQMDQPGTSTGVEPARRPWAVDQASITRAEGGPRTISRAPRSNGGVRPAARQYAPATHALIGAFEQAGFGLRYGAWMFDFLITLIAIMVFTFAVTAASRRSLVASNTDLLIVSGLTLVLFLANFVVLAGLGGQTAGMRILGIYILRVDGSPFLMRHAALRHLIGYPISTLSFFLGFLWMLWDPRQQGWHDKLSRTIVVMAK